MSKNRIKITEKSIEYAPDIIHSRITNKVFIFNGNVKNTGLITNLQQNSIVEVPCIANISGIHPLYVGDLPPQCAALNRTNINVQELAVKAALEGNSELAFQSVMLDPLTSAVLAPHEIRKMVEEMLKAEKKWLPQF
jgi:alpha-galactosidase